MIKNILFDFDGVIIDSMPIRSYGFEKIFEKYKKEDVEKLIIYNEENGGLSRFHKIKYFYNDILHKEISEEEINNYAKSFSLIMKNELVNKKYLIKDSVEFIKFNHTIYNLHIVSGSEEKELNYLCQELGLKDFFKTIEGSPTPKNNLVKNILDKFQYKKDETILIGDSINDYEAANINGIDFYGYNNVSLKNISKIYLENYGIFR